MSDRQTGNSTVLARLVRLGSPGSRAARQSLGLGSLAALCAIGLAATSAWLLARASERPAILSLTAIIGVVQLLAIGRAGLGYAERLSSHDWAFRVLARLRVTTFEALEPLAPGTLGTERSGDLLARAVDDVDTLQNFYLRVLQPVGVGVIAGGLSCAVAWLLVPSSGMVLLAGLLVGGALIPLLGHRLALEPARHLAERSGELMAEVVDLVQGASELVAWGEVEHFQSRVLAIDADLARRRCLAARRRGVVMALGTMVTGMTAIGMLATGVAAVRSGHLPGVELAVLPILGLATMEVLSNLPTALSHLPEDVAAGRRLLELETAPLPVTDPLHPAPKPAGTPDLSIRDLAVRYGSEPVTALDGLALDLAAGRRVGLVGPSGSGKTSLIHVLLRFWPRTAGTVRLDSFDVEELLGDDVRAVVGALDDRTYLFATSIEANIRLARPEASTEEVAAVVESVQLSEWVSGLPRGLATEVGEQGAQVSGGERQRIALARLLLADLPIVLLDEPTVGLDTATAGRLLDDVLALLEGHSVLLVTHRPEEVAGFDAVVDLGGPGRPVDHCSQDAVLDREQGLGDCHQSRSRCASI